MSGWSLGSGAQTIAMEFVRRTNPTAQRLFSVRQAGPIFSAISLINYAGYAEITCYLGGAGGNSIGCNPVLGTGRHTLVVCYDGSGSTTPANYAIFLVDGTAQTVVSGNSFLDAVAMGALGSYKPCDHTVSCGHREGRRMERGSPRDRGLQSRGGSMASPYGFILAVVTAEARETVEAALNALLQPLHPDLQFIGTFSLGLSADGSVPATHYGASSVILDEDLPALLQAAPAFGSALQVWLGSKPDNDPEGAVIITDPVQSTGAALERWADLDTAAASLGLVRVAILPF